MNLSKAIKIEELGHILLQTGILLMSSGANTQRVRNTLKRMSEAYSVEAEVLITHKALHLYLRHRENGQTFQKLQKSFVYNNNLSLISGISELSWKIAEGGWSLAAVQKELDGLREQPRYPLVYILLTVSLAGAAFGRLFGGNLADMNTVFGSTLCGLLMRNFAIGKQFNTYLSIFLASFTAALVAHLSGALFSSVELSHALPAALLFLVPGIPLINSFSDFVDGHLLNGLLHSLNSLLITFAITLGYLTAHGLWKQWGGLL